MSEQTKHLDLIKRNSGIRAGHNIRIIENKFEGQERLVLYGSYFEFERLGQWYGYWTPKHAKEIRNYISDWLKRMGEE